MNCPSCKNVNLSMSERNGIEIDYCPQCRGVWLDRGELDKIIEKASAHSEKEPDRKLSNQELRVDPREEHRYRQDDHHSKDYYKYKRKKSFLSELFD